MTLHNHIMIIEQVTNFTSTTTIFNGVIRLILTYQMDEKNILQN